MARGRLGDGRAIDSWGTVGLHPELRVRLLHGYSDDVISHESSDVFETVLAETGYDVEMIGVDSVLIRPSDSPTETVMGLAE